MREQQRGGGRLPSWRLVLVSVMGMAVAVTAVGLRYEVDETPTPQRAPAIDSPLVASTAQVPPVVASPEPRQDADASPSRPSDRTTVDADRSHAAAPVTMAAAAPVRLQIPSIGVDTGLMDLGLQPDGTLEVPPSGSSAGWYTGAPTPGELGPAIIAGHVDWGGRPGVFFDLRELPTGEEIMIVRQDGSTARFQVTRVERFAKRAFPTLAVYGDIDHAGLRLITCGGRFDRRLRSYDDNLVVFAELVGVDASHDADPGLGYG